jgi:hypothetical protein
MITKSAEIRGVEADELFSQRAAFSKFMSDQLFIEELPQAASPECVEVQARETAPSHSTTPNVETPARWFRNMLTSCGVFRVRRSAHMS